MEQKRNQNKPHHAKISTNVMVLLKQIMRLDFSKNWEEYRFFKTIIFNNKNN